MLAACWGECLVTEGFARAGALPLLLTTPCPPHLTTPWLGFARAVSEVAIVPQRAILLSGTIAENILIGRVRDEARMRRVIEQCDRTPRSEFHTIRIQFMRIEISSYRE